jgi:hypothetical protein
MVRYIQGLVKLIIVSVDHGVEVVVGNGMGRETSAAVLQILPVYLFWVEDLVVARWYPCVDIYDEDLLP